MKKTKQFVAAILIGILLLTTTACGNTKPAENSASGSQTPVSSTDSGGASSSSAEKPNELAWLDASGKLPIVAEGTEKTLSIYYLEGSTDSGDPEGSWLYQFIENHMNINLEVTTFSTTNKAEFLSLAFAGDELPDIIIGGGFTTTQLMNYGASEGQLVDLAPYINETYMPNFTKLYQDYNYIKEGVTDADGHVWSLGFFTSPASRDSISRSFLNYDMLEEMNIPVPTTLDEFVDLLRKVKAQYPDSYPAGGSYAYQSQLPLYIMNAYGYITTDNRGLSVALRDGEVVLPVADRAAYGAYLTTMNALYKEGIMHPDYFTMDTAATKANLSDSNIMFMPQAAYLFQPDNYEAYWGALPLTSDYNDTPQWPAAKGATPGQAVVTSHCKDVELAAAFLDWFYNEDNYQMSISGPSADLKEYTTEKVPGWVWSDDWKKINTYYDEHASEYASSADYLFKEVKMWNNSILGVNIDATSNPQSWNYKSDPDLSAYANKADGRHSMGEKMGDKHFRLGLQYTLKDYVTLDTYPSAVYFDAETASYLNSLYVIISEYATQETAKFITGARSLDELDAYFDEIEKLGAKEYVQYYSDYYKSIK